MRVAYWCLLGCTSLSFAAEPQKATLWIDLATYSGVMVPVMGARGGFLGGILGGKNTNVFGNTQTGLAGRWMDVTLAARKVPGLKEAILKVPAGSLLAPRLNLFSPQEGLSAQVTESDDEAAPVPDFKKPKGKILLYWGCGSEVRKGQPRVLDMASANAADFSRIFQSRRATTRGSHSTSGHPVWPNKNDNRMIADNASLQGEHELSGEGTPEGLKFSLDARHDLMPAISLKQREEAQFMVFNWAAMPQAKAWFMASMSMKNQDEMVLWSSSELPDTGFGLLDYQPNTAIEGWLKEKVLLPAASNECKVPKEALGQAAMLRLMAYGDELNLVYPPKPKDPKVVWNPQWSVKVRLKSMVTTMPGAVPMDKPAGERQRRTPDAVDLLKGIFWM